MIMCFTLTLLDAALSLPLRESVFVGFLCFCRNFASIWQVSPAICTSSSRTKPTTEPPWGNRKIRGKTGPPFPGKNTTSTPRNSNTKNPRTPNPNPEKYATKKPLYCFRTNPGGHKTSLWTTLSLASALLMQDSINVWANHNSVASWPGKRGWCQP